ncbi:hypothetical protein BY458DRAFT_525016 [Sporodiniella umbellata]|nr:hypothetical protein BY458DRAFT_525016 [Sporodiniella umbellata]
MKYILLVYLFSVVYALIPTQTYVRQQSIDRPTPAPERHMKRDVEEVLSLYENWADSCNQRNNVQVDLPNVNGLWKTLTSTVYCGNGQRVTVTKTVTATTTAKTNGGKGGGGNTTCDSKCWSDYLWHTYGYGISVAQGFTGTLLGILGIYFLIFGFGSFRGTLAAVGFVFFGCMTWIGLVNNEPQYGYPHNEVVYISVSCGLGLLGGFLFMYIYSIAVYFIGCLGGFFLAVFILSWKESLTIQIQVARICFIVGMGVVFAIFIFLAESYVVIFCTAFIGAYLLIFGIDLFAHTGMVNAFLVIFDGNQYHKNVYILRVTVYVMLAFIIFLTLVSFGWQYYWNIISKKKGFGVNIQEKCEEKEEA